MSTSQSIFQGDNTAAFGNNYITININNPLGYPISKAVFVTGNGNIKKTFENPEFPLIVNFTSQETQQLKANNVGYLVVFDSQGRQKTCNGSLTFHVKNGVLCNG